MKIAMESMHPYWKRFEAEYNEFMLPAGDGVELFTQVFAPSKDANGAVVIIRTPYESDEPIADLICGFHAELVRAGYTLVSQHCRGCGRSTGVCIPYLNERQDGLVLLDWIRKQSFYNKEIYLVGSSYLSSVHYSYLNVAGDDIKGAVFPVQDCVRYNILYRNGFFKSGLHGSWAVKMYEKNMKKKRNYTDDSFRIMPLSNFSKVVFGEEYTFLNDEFRHPDPADPFWQTPEGGSDYCNAFDNIDIPILFIGSFYDIYTEGMFDMWRRLSPQCRSKSAFIVSPYSHSYWHDTILNYPHGNPEESWPNFRVEWLNTIHEKRKIDFIEPGCITWYAQNEGIWRTAPDLENGSKAVTFVLNDHTLDAEAADEKAITYVYNPYDPAEFKGGCCNNFGGQQLQDPPDSRYDIISFITPSVERDIVFQGVGKVTLKVSSDCEDTCFYARLSHINKDGECYCMRDDIISLRTQHPDYVPGTAVEVRLNFAPNAFKLSAGEKLRLDISSSCWRYFIPHRNKIGNYWELESADIANNTIFTGNSELLLFEREQQ